MSRKRRAPKRIFLTDTKYKSDTNFKINEFNNVRWKKNNC